MPVVVVLVMPADPAAQAAVVVVVHQQEVLVVVLHLPDRETRAVLGVVQLMQAAAAAVQRQRARLQQLPLQVAQAAQAIVHILRGQVQQQQVAAGHIPAVAAARLKIC